MSQKIIYICGSLAGRLSIALLAALIKSRPRDEVETILVQLEDPIPPPPVFLLTAPRDERDDQQVNIITSDGHLGHSLRNQRSKQSQAKNFASLLVRSRRAQSMTRRCKHRN